MYSGDSATWLAAGASLNETSRLRCKVGTARAAASNTTPLNTAIGTQGWLPDRQRAVIVDIVSSPVPENERFSSACRDLFGGQRSARSVWVRTPRSQHARFRGAGATVLTYLLVSGRFQSLQQNATWLQDATLEITWARSVPVPSAEIAPDRPRHPLAHRVWAQRSGR
jgi:hypothetical protein